MFEEQKLNSFYLKKMSQEESILKKLLEEAEIEEEENKNIEEGDCSSLDNLFLIDLIQ